MKPLNVVALAGRLARAGEERVLATGDRVVNYDVTVRRPGEPPETVPVVWIKPPASATKLAADTEVIVIGRVRRRFFRVSGSTQSRTEVVADAVVPARNGRGARAALERVYEQFEDATS